MSSVFKSLGYKNKYVEFNAKSVTVMFFKIKYILNHIYCIFISLSIILLLKSFDILIKGVLLLL